MASKRESCETSACTSWLEFPKFRSVGDSGSAALVTIAGPERDQINLKTVLLGVQAQASLPCVDNAAVWIFPQTFKEFLVKASRDLGSPLPLGTSWRDYN